MTTRQLARDQIAQLVQKHNAIPEAERPSLTEANVLHQFITPLLTALGWPITDPARCKFELSTQTGRPDVVLFPEAGGPVYVEAKRFGVIAPLAEAKNRLEGIVTPGQLSLPGMAADRTAEEQQAINYAFSNNGAWAILTNFERLRLFNARRDWLVLSFERPSAYLDEFDQLWQLSYASIVDGRLDQLSNQRHREDVDANYLSFINEWRERLAQDILHKQADNWWVLDDNGRVQLPQLRAVVQQILDRLVVVRFAEDHLIIPAGTLFNLAEVRRTNPYTFSLTQFLQQLFRRFDEDHNSALFAPALADQAIFSDGVLDGLIAKLYEARYRAMTADIMGNTYEQYLGKTLVLKNLTGLRDLSGLGNLSGLTVTTSDNLETRKKQGSYYTPQVIVRYLVDHSLGRYLYGDQFDAVAGVPTEPHLARSEDRPDRSSSPKTAVDIQNLRVIDPACGSGSFLIYAYERLADFYRREITRLEAARQARYAELVAQGITTPFELQLQLTPFTTELERLAHYPRLILENHLYGVDLDPQAAEIATVNLMMRAMADQRRADKRLPLILNQNIKVGNALIGAGPDDPRLAAHTEALAELRRLRQEAIGGHHSTAVQQQIAALSQQVNEALNKDLTGFENLSGLVDETVRPFNWAVEFPEVFIGRGGTAAADIGQNAQPPSAAVSPSDAASAGRDGAEDTSAASTMGLPRRPAPTDTGFHIVIGNPPWEVIQPDLREFYAQFDSDIESKLTRQQVETRIAELNIADPTLADRYEAQTTMIKRMAAYFKESSAYSWQGKGKSSTHNLFLERGYSLLRTEGRLAFVIPSGIYTDLGTKELREMLLHEGRIEYLYNFSNERFFFPHVDHRVKFTLLGAQKGAQSDGFWATFRFNPRVAVSPEDLHTFLANHGNLIYIERETIQKFSPDTLSLMEFQTQKDYQIAETLYSDWPLLGQSVSDSWRPVLSQEFNVTSDRTSLNTRGNGIPLYEGKMIHQFDAYFADPRYWISEEKVLELPVEKRAQLETFRVVHRRIARATDERTLISAIVPPKSGCEVNATVILLNNCEEEHPKLYLCAILNSFVLDYIIRYKISTTLNMFYMYQLPVPRLTAVDPIFNAIVARAAALTCTTPAFAPLWEAVMGTPFQVPGTSEVPGTLEVPGTYPTTDPAVRQRLRDELDAIIAHLYRLSRADFAHILDTFPLVFPPTPAGQAKKETLLATYDQAPDWFNTLLNKFY